MIVDCCLCCTFPASYSTTLQAYECGRVRAVRQAAIIWHLHLLLLELLRPCLIINPIGSWMLPSTFYQTSSTSLAWSLIAACAAASLPRIPPPRRLMDAAEYVLSDQQRLSRADMALEQLSNAITDNAILHLIANLDAAADLELMIRSGQQLLGWLLAEPMAMGQAIGQVIDEVAGMERLKVAVQRNDEVRLLLLLLLQLCHKMAMGVEYSSA
jgi:hypothetical protein